MQLLFALNLLLGRTRHTHQELVEIAGAYVFS